MSKYELIVAAGPLEGERIRLEPQATLLIGRTPRGLNLPDPQVSPRHAEISWSGDRFWIVDLESTTGTVVNGRRVGREPLALHPGMRIEIGESVLVLKMRQTLPTWLLWFVAVFVVIFGPLSVYTGFMMFSGLTKNEPALHFSSQDLLLRTPNCGDLEQLLIDPCFMQETGQNQTLYWKKLRDLDGDGYDELWLEHPDGERIYTFGETCDERGQPNWLLMAKLPKECIAQDNHGLADLQCPGQTTYRYMKGAPLQEAKASCSNWSQKGRYKVVGQSGVTAWMPRSANNTEAGGPFPYQFTFFKPDTLAGFLEARGIDEPIHFLVCEDFLPGLAPQVLTQSGEIKPLQWGCIRELSLDGTMKDRWFGSDLPKAVAFTSIGRSLLVEQSAVFLSGTPDVGFMTPWQEQLWGAIKRSPESRSSVLLSFHSPDQGLFWGGADEVDSLEVSGRLERLKLAEPVPPLGNTWNGGEKISTLHARCGCSILSVRMGEPIVPSNFGRQNYLTLEEVGEEGCGGSGGVPMPWTVPYVSGRYRFHHSNIEVEVDLKMTSGDQIAQVVSVGISYRTPYPCREGAVRDFPIQKNMFEEIR